MGILPISGVVPEEDMVARERRDKRRKQRELVDDTGDGGNMFTPGS